MIVVSFTTSPKRINLCERMVDSILNQSVSPDVFLLNIPKKYRGEESYDVPSFIKEKVSLNVIEKDLGPGTKIVPTPSYCKKEGIKASKYIYVDDDIEYPERMIESMMFCSDLNLAVSASCFSIIKSINDKQIIGYHNERIINNYQIIEGFAGVCVSAEDIDGLGDFYKTLPDHKCVVLSDDFYLSVFFHSKGIKLAEISIPGVYCFLDLQRRFLDYGLQEDALHSEGNISRYIEAFRMMQNTVGVKFPTYNEFN
jgi:hypothetical protein